jgi:tetratricopeptide (TPR) repeat protein
LKFRWAADILTDVNRGLILLCIFFATASVRGDDQRFPPELLPQSREARAAFEKGDYPAAAAVYEKLRSVAPKNLAVLSNLAVTRFKMEQYREAERVLRDALAIEPGDAFCRRTLGVLYYAWQKYDDAINELTKALAIDPRDAEAHLYLSFCAAQKGWDEAAQKELKTAGELNPDFASETAPRHQYRGWAVGDYLTPLERSRLTLPTHVRK